MTYNLQINSLINAVCVRVCVRSVLADAKGLSNPADVEALREKVYASLESYTKQKYPNQPGR